MVDETPPAHSTDCAPGGAISIGLDQLFRYAASQRPDAVALVDPPDRERFTEGEPRALTYAQADRAITSIAARLGQLGLVADDVVALQLPNTVEGVLALLGVLRAGLIAAPLPLLWRCNDCGRALSMIEARALLTASRIGTTDHGAIAVHVSATGSTVSHVGLFGGCRDGTVPFDDVLDVATSYDPPTRCDADTALVTFEMTSAGPVPVARTHLEATMAGFDIVFESRLTAESVILSPVPLSSVAGIATTLGAWLLTRGTLVLHHPFDHAIMRRQVGDHRCGTIILPGSLAARCATSPMCDKGVANVIALWRAPERLAACPVWLNPATAITDVTAFGEIGLITGMRGSDGRPARIDTVAAIAPTRQLTHGVGPTEATRTAIGTLALRGPTVPRGPFRQAMMPGQRALPVPDAAGFIDTGYPCRLTKSGALVVTGPPAGVVGVGGYRLAAAALQEAVSRIEPAAMIAGVPDRLTGQRLAGVAARREEICQTLAQLGFNPLTIDAFRSRRGTEAAAPKGCEEGEVRSAA